MNIVFTMVGKCFRFRLFGSSISMHLLTLRNGMALSLITVVMKRNCVGPNFYFITARNDQLSYPILQSFLKSFEIFIAPDPSREVFHSE